MKERARSHFWRNFLIVLIVVSSVSQIVRAAELHENNTWYLKNGSDTVVVFVHGIFSNSSDCWTSPQGQYWPDLVTHDARLEHPAIFLGGYYTAFEAGAFGVRDAAKQLRDRMLAEGVFSKPKIIFIAHSTGGIVVRYMLYHDRDLFVGKWIGLMLYASPSSGSYLANVLSVLSSTYNQKLGSELQVGSATLEELDQNFKDLLARGSSSPSGLRIVGAEAIENHFIFHRKFLPDIIQVVSADSGSRYFGSANRLANTDHFSIVKPTGPNHVSHEFLLTFYRRFKELSHHSIELSPDLSDPHLRLEAYRDNRTSNPNHGPTSTVLLHGPVSVDVTNGSITTSGLRYENPEGGYPYVLGDSSQGRLVLHPGTFSTSSWGASLGCMIVDQGTYHISGEFQRMNDIVSGDGVDVLVVLDDNVNQPLFRDHIAADDHLRKSFDRVQNISPGHVIRFLVFSGPDGKDGTYDATALIAKVEWY